MKRAAKNTWIIISVLAIVVVIAGNYYYAALQARTDDETSIETTTIGTGDIILSATGLGTLVPGEQVFLGFKNSGQVSEALVSLGETVEAGQVLARLESETIELKYKQAEANLASLASPVDLAEAEQAVQDAKESFAIARDDLQFLIGPDMLYAEEEISNAQDELEAAKDAAEKEVSDTNQQKVSEAESALAAARAAYTYVYYEYATNYISQTFTYPIRNDHGVTIRKELIAPTDSELLATRAAYELAKANLEDAQNYLDVLQGTKTSDEVPASSVTPITEAKIAFDQAKADLDATELIAPISGTITSISLSVGDFAGTSAVVTITNLNEPYTIEAYLDEIDWDKAKIGYSATVTFDLLPDDNFSGMIIQVYPALDDSSGVSMVRVRVQLDESIGMNLPAGSTASVDVTGGEVLGAVLVPISALKELEPGKYMVYLMKNGEPVEQEVEIGLQDILYAEVKSGLEAGDVVLTNAALNE